VHMQDSRRLLNVFILITLASLVADTAYRKPRRDAAQEIHKFKSRASLTFGFF
jgi:hypothetical protein